MRHTSLIAWLSEMHEQGAYLAAVCSGAAFLAETGSPSTAARRPRTGAWPTRCASVIPVRWRPDQFVTEDGRLCCSGGVYASIDISLYLVEKFCGHEVALQCAKSLLVGLPRSRQSGYAVTPLSRPHAESASARRRSTCAAFPDDIGIEALAERSR